MTRSPAAFAMTLGLLAAAGALVVAPSPAREVSLPAPLVTFPASFDGWVGSDHAPTSALPVDPRESAHLLRAYGRGNDTVWVALSYYARQSEGRRAAALEILFPNHGWSRLSTRAVRIPLGEPGGPSIPANLVVTQEGDDQVAILYWYQVQAHSIASDHWYRALLLYNRLVHHRTDGAFVRVAARVTGATPVGAVVDEEMRFVRAFYPQLLRSLPR